MAPKKIRDMNRAFHLTDSVRTRAGVVELSFSSEAPVMVKGVPEVLEHGEGNVDLSRLNAGAPVLFEHNREKQIGIVEKVWIDASERKGRAQVRFGTSQLAQEVARDVSAGIRRGVSVGYQTVKAVIVNGVRRVSAWMPLEISIVSIPADISVGVGRSAKQTRTTAAPSNHNNTMKSVELKQRRGGIIKRAADIAERATAAAREMTDDEVAVRGNLLDIARDLDRDILTAESEERSEKSKACNFGRTIDCAGDYSIVRALRGMASGRLDGLEAEYSQEYARRSGVNPTGFFVPLEALNTRDLTATGGTSGSEGGALSTPTTDAFIDALRARLVIAKLGATVLGGLTADVKLPRQSAASTASWKAENAELAEQSPTFDQVSLTPRRVGGYTEISKQLLVQTGGEVEKLVRGDLLSAIAIAVDAAAIAGSGSAPVPRGILSTSGIGAVALGTNGAAPSYNSIVDLISEIADADADLGTISFLTNSKVRGKLAKTMFDSGSGLTVWDKAQSLGLWALTSSVPSNLTKAEGSSLSAIIAGDFSQLLVGQFGGALDVVVDPFTKATTGITRVVAHGFFDVAVRRAEYFAAITDASTA